MKPATIEMRTHSARGLLNDLERRHNDVLDQLDDLNRRVEQALADARRQFQSEGVAEPAAMRVE